MIFGRLASFLQPGPVLYPENRHQRCFPIILEQKPPAIFSQNKLLTTNVRNKSISLYFLLLTIVQTNESFFFNFQIQVYTLDYTSTPTINESRPKLSCRFWQTSPVTAIKIHGTYNPEGKLALPHLKINIFPHI